MGIIDDLMQIPEREVGGRTAYDRFDYQTAWGLMRVLELHSSGADYAVAFEFHDDVAELDQIDSPERLRFYQVKTTSGGGWSLAKIAQRRAGTTERSSYAGRMFDNVRRFGDGVEKVVFVTNRPLVDLPGGTAEEAELSSADEKKLEKFVASLTGECPDFSPEDHLGLFRFLECGLDLKTYDSTVLGETTVFLEKVIGSGEDARQFHFLMLDECRRRSKRLSDVSGIDELCRSKFLTRAALEAKLASFRGRRQTRPVCASVVPHLGLDWKREHALEREWRNYELSRFERFDASTVRFSDEIKNIVDPIMEAADSMTEGVAKAVPLVRPLVRERFGPKLDAFVEAIVLYEFKR